MPEISKFYGIIIYMYIDDHNPPHFHVWYDDYQAEITIKEGIVRGEMPRRALRLVFEWLDLHRDELLENWERLSNCEAAVVAAEYVRDYTLRLTFNTGEVRLVDFTPLMQKGICRKLQDLDYFKSFRLDPFTVDWNDEIGFAPRYLYERGMAA